MEANHKYKTFRLAGKVAILTASTQGIGLATAERLGHEGCKVVISSRNQKNVDEAVKSLVRSGLQEENIAAIACHVGNPEHRRTLIQLALDRFGRIDIVFHNAGINPATGDVLKVTQQQWEKIFDVNVKAPFLLSQMIVPHMQKVGGGSIIFNASLSALRNSEGIYVYGMSKTALLALVKTMSMSLAKKNIRVNSVIPGQIKTRMSQQMWDETHPRHKIVKQSVINSFGWLGRIGQPEEIASAVAYLVSDDGRFITGENHLVHGGCDARL
ncbi:Dehydrogenase/reductase SDR family member 4 [Aphelenchoides besseyi]|nr:Dehydrogenase/reductase SDR family member 4 [Aphelenchoides besseyi]